MQGRAVACSLQGRIHAETQTFLVGGRANLLPARERGGGYWSDVRKPRNEIDQKTGSEEAWLTLPATIAILEHA
jgi:hypothetical protein